jgi:hypothetical protein
VHFYSPSATFKKMAAIKKVDSFLALVLPYIVVANWHKVFVYKTRALHSKQSSTESSSRQDYESEKVSTDKLATSISGLEPYRKYMAFVEKQNKE